MVWPNHMIGDSIRKKIVSVTVLAMKRPAPPKALRSCGRETTSITVAIFGANHMISVMTNSAMPASGRMKFAGPWIATRERAEHQQSHPGGRAEEHQHRERDLVAADGLEPRHHQDRASTACCPAPSAGRGG